LWGLRGSGFSAFRGRQEPIGNCGFGKVRRD